MCNSLFSDIFLFGHNKMYFILQFKLSYNVSNEKNHVRRRNEEESSIEAIRYTITERVVRETTAFAKN